MSTAVQPRGRSMDHLPEVVQAVTAAVGVLTAAISAVVVRVRLKANSELRKIDVSAEWQGQMLSRIGAVEAELRAERARGDALEQEGFQWRRQASELEWELRSARSERHAVVERMDLLAHENELLKRQNRALAAELNELNHQIRTGHPAISLAPLPLKRKTNPEGDR